MTQPTPPRSRRARLASTAVAASLALALLGCGTTSDDNAKPTPTTGADGEPAAMPVDATDAGCTDEVATSTEPVTLTDDLGRTVELDAPATRIAALEWQQVEDLLTLCVTPVAMADTAGYRTWVTAVPLPDGIADVGTRQEPNLDALLEADPDLVVLEVSDDDALVDQIEEKGIAVLATTGASTEDPIGHMLDTFRLLGEATGRSERADAVATEFQATLDEATTTMTEADLPGTDFVYLDGWVQGGNVSLRPFGQGSLVGELGETLGLENVWTGPVDEAYGLGQTDIEGMADVTATWVLHTGYDGGDPQVGDVMGTLEANPIWNSLPAVKAERLRSFPVGIWTFGGPRSSQQVIDAFVDVLTA